MSSYTDRRLIDVYQSTEDISIKSQSLRLLSQRHGTEYLVNGSTICSLLENIRMQASHSSTPDWSSHSSTPDWLVDISTASHWLLKYCFYVQF